MLKNLKSKPHRRVGALSVILLSVMVLVVALGTFGVHQMRADFDQLVEEDIPRLDYLVHVERELFRAQRQLEVALSASDETARFDAVDQYYDLADLAEQGWNGYLDVPAGGGEEEQARQLQRDEIYHEWIESSGALARLISNGSVAGDPAAREALDQSQAEFAVLRLVVRQLEQDVAEPLISDTGRSVSDQASGTIENLVVLLIFGLVVGGLVSLTTYRSTRSEFRDSAARKAVQANESARAAFEAELGQAMEMAHSEEAAHITVGLVLVGELQTRVTDLQLADSSSAHLKLAATTELDRPAAACRVIEPWDCPAIRRGTSLSFPDSDAYSACVHLRGREGTQCSAVCVPVSVAGRTVGVLHSTTQRDEVLEDDTIYKLEKIASRAGDRIGVLRAFSQSETQAATDPLTGLLNRRSFENQASQRLRSGGSIAIGYGDLDNFKLLNDRHGHDMGDRALRLFSRVVVDSLRDGDIAARWGGEEFVILFADSDAATAAAALDRMRNNLMVALAGASSPPFTVSFGVADTTKADDLEDLVALADGSLLEAKRKGRDCVVKAGSWESSPAEPLESDSTEEQGTLVESIGE